MFHHHTQCSCPNNQPSVITPSYSNQFEYIVVDCNTKKVTIPNQAYTIGTQGDHGVTSIHFMLLNCPSRIDPDDCKVTIKYTNALKEDGEAEADNVVHDERTMLITFPVPDDLVKKGGKVKLGISLQSDVYRWNISWIGLWVQPFRPSVDPNPSPAPGPTPDPPTPIDPSQIEAVVADLQVRVKRLEDSELEIPDGYIEKNHLSQKLKDELTFESDLEAMDSDDVEALWNS